MQQDPAELLKKLLKTSQGAYAAVADFAVIEDEIEQGLLHGFAAPANGLLPCAVVLWAGNRVMSVARATGYLEQARVANFRLGWCGFRVGGLAQSIALGQDAELRCLVSGQVLGRWDGDHLANSVRPNQTRLSFPLVRERIKVERGCRDVEEVLPFAMELLHTRGPRALLEASYRYIHNRELDEAGAAGFSKELTSEENIISCWRIMMDSHEFQAKQTVYLPGPYDPGFPFPLVPLTRKMDPRNIQRLHSDAQTIVKNSYTL